MILTSVWKNCAGCEHSRLTRLRAASCGGFRAPRLISPVHGRNNCQPTIDPDDPTPRLNLVTNTTTLAWLVDIPLTPEQGYGPVIVDDTINNEIDIFQTFISAIQVTNHECDWWPDLHRHFGHSDECKITRSLHESSLSHENRPTGSG